MGYLAPIDAIDVSNSNTPGVVDPTNPVGENVFRVVAQVDAKGQFSFTEDQRLQRQQRPCGHPEQQRWREFSLHRR